MPLKKRSVDSRWIDIMRNPFNISNPVSKCHLCYSCCLCNIYLSILSPVLLHDRYTRLGARPIGFFPAVIPNFVILFMALNAPRLLASEIHVKFLQFWRHNDHETIKQIIPCGNCGTRHIVIPPNKEYLSLMDYPCPRIDYQKSYYNCKKCSFRNIFYWHKKHHEDLVFQSK